MHADDISPMMWQIPVDGGSISALFEPATEQPRRATFVCAHGAGGHMADAAMSSVARTLRSRGIDMVRFNFLYREQGSRRPDPMPRLQACIDAVVAHVRSSLTTPLLIVGGRSMGGRAASMLAADGAQWDGLLLLAYPLHPAGQPEKLRDAHLPRIRMPVLCCNGTRDALCTRELMERALQNVSAPWDMHWLAGADHSFHVLKSSGRTDTDVMNEVADATIAWLSPLARAELRA
jgi:predicted alpha/beta-hydrolase family hydrolase